MTTETHSDLWAGILEPAFPSESAQTTLDLIEAYKYTQLLFIHCFCWRLYQEKIDDR